MSELISLEQFEKAVSERDYETAVSGLLSILNKLDSNFGTLVDIQFHYPHQLAYSEQEVAVHFCQRMAVAMAELFHSRHTFGISDDGFKRLMTCHRWISIIFASSSYMNADHVIRSYNQNAEESDINVVHLENDLNVWKKFCILYSPESNINLSLDTLWNISPALCASLCFALQSPRFIATQGAFSKRSAVLKWFPEKLKLFNNLNDLPSGISHDVYMHCSYDIDADKHRVKESLNQVIRKHILELGWQDRDVSKVGKTNDKPVMFVVLEHFHSSHSIYRTHSTSMIAAREHFHLVGFGSEAVDELGRAVFDEFYEVEGSFILDKLNFIRNLAEQYQPSVLYMPSIGMDLTPIFLSNTQIAPIQTIALGHPATTHSPFIDYVIVEDDYVGSEDCFSETLLRLPKDALPYVPSALAPTSVEYHLRENPDVVHIGIASTTMKLNPFFLKACQEIRNRAKVKVHFHFALGQSSGITHPYSTRFIKSYLGSDASVYTHRPYHDYLQVLHQCDMMINPFPFGNTNGIIDMVTLGLVGICKTGNEVHEHIDEGLFARLGLPVEQLVAKTADEYIERALWLAENHAERLALRRQIIENNGLQTLFTGNPKPMGDILFAKVVEKGLLSAEPVQKATAKKSTAKKTAKPKAETNENTEVKTTAKKRATRTKKA